METTYDIQPQTIKKYTAFLKEVSRHNQLRCAELINICRDNHVSTTIYVHMNTSGQISKISKGLYNINIKNPTPRDARILAESQAKYFRKFNKITNKKLTQLTNKTFNHVQTKNINYTPPQFIMDNWVNNRNPKEFTLLLMKQFPGHYSSWKTAREAVRRFGINNPHSGKNNKNPNKKNQQTIDLDILHKTDTPTVKNEAHTKDSNLVLVQQNLMDKINQKVSNTTFHTWTEKSIELANKIVITQEKLARIESVLFPPPKPTIRQKLNKWQQRQRATIQSKWNKFISKLIIKNN